MTDDRDRLILAKLDLLGTIIGELRAAVDGAAGAPARADVWPPEPIDPRDPDWCSLQEAAWLSNRHPNTLSERLRRDEPPIGVKYFGRWLVSRRRLLRCR